MNDYRDFRLRIDLLQFNGNMHIEEFINWIAEVKHIFNYLDISEFCKVKLVVLHFKGVASAWWDPRFKNRRLTAG